jgi:hypothetical protein
VLTLHDQHYLDDAGQWQDAVEGWATDGADGFDFGVSRLRHRVRLTALTGVFRYHPVRGALLKYVTVGRPQRKGTGQLWPAMLLGTRSQAGNLQSFDAADHGYDVLSTWRQVKTFYRLKDSSAPTRVRWELTFTGLTFDWATREARDGSAVVARLGLTTAWDANNAAVPVTETWNGQYLELTIDTTGAAFPVTVDPTFTDGYGGDTTTACDDGMIGAAGANNCGIGISLHIQETRKILQRYILAGISSSATCNSATLYNYKWTDDANQTATVYHIADANGDWIEGTKSFTQAGAGEPCWNAKAANGSGGVTTAWAGSAGLSTATTDYNATALGSFSLAATDIQGREYTTTLTASVVQGWFGDATNNGILIAGTGAANIQLCSSDSETTGYRPKLVVDYTAGASSIVASLSGSGSLASAQPRSSSPIVASASGASSLSANITLTAPIVASLSGAGSLAAAASAEIPISAALSGAGSLSADVTVVSGESIAVALSGAGSLTAALTNSIPIEAAFGGAGSLAAAVLTATEIDATLSGAGALAVDLVAVAPIAASLSGVGSLSAAVEVMAASDIVASLSGAGTLTADVTTSVPITAALSAAGSLVASVTTPPSIIAAPSAPVGGALTNIWQYLRPSAPLEARGTATIKLLASARMPALVMEAGRSLVKVNLYGGLRVTGRAALDWPELRAALSRPRLRAVALIDGRLEHAYYNLADYEARMVAMERRLTEVRARLDDAEMLQWLLQPKG